jgi:hypothetical protein
VKPQIMATRTPAWLFPAATLLGFGLAGCSSAGPDKSCLASHEYLESRSLPPLVIPEGLSPPDRSDELVIPDGARASTNADPDGQCLDLPPDYFGKKKPVAASGQAADPPEAALPGKVGKSSAAD